jgi:dTDP-4-dehydrorhamnose reductase
MNILVTGANGQLGNEMQVLARENLQHTYFFTDVQELDICDEQAVYAYVSEHKIDIIVNCAAYTAVDKAEDNVELCDKLNNIAPGYLARAAQANGAAMIQVSTDYVFDGTAHIPYTEEEPTCPASVYGSTKLAGEQNVMDHCEKAMVIRTAWLYSIYGNNFVNRVLHAADTKDELLIASDQFGSPTSAKDLARIILYLIKTNEYGTYHATCQGVCNRYEFAQEVLKLAGKRITLRPVVTSESDLSSARPAYAVLDNFILRIINVYEMPDWRASLKEYMDERMED